MSRTTDWNAVFTVLVEECGASESMREHFVYDHEQRRISEWRFGGSLGYGGKFWDNGGRYYVSCYPEDEKRVSMECIEKANRRLEALHP